MPARIPRSRLICKKTASRGPKAGHLENQISKPTKLQDNAAFVRTSFPFFIQVRQKYDGKTILMFRTAILGSRVLRKRHQVRIVRNPPMERIIKRKTQVRFSARHLSYKRSEFFYSKLRIQKIALDELGRSRISLMSRKCSPSIFLLRL